MDRKEFTYKAVEYFKTPLGWFTIALGVLVLALLCARCSDPIAVPWPVPEPATPPVADEPLAVEPVPPAFQVIEGATPGNAFTAPWIVTLGAGQRDTFRVRVEGVGDQELVLFQTDTAVAEFVPDWQVESRRGALAASDWTAILQDAQVIHIEREHFGTGGYHEWSVPIEGKAVGKTQVFFLWQEADGSNPVHGSFDVEVLP